MKICFVENYSEANPEGFIEEMVRLGHTITPVCDETCDVIFFASIEKIEVVESYIRSSPGIPLVIYCWDYYKWAHEGKHRIDWKPYADLLKKAALILVPSKGQQLRLKELLGLRSTVCACSITTYEHPVQDKRYVLDPVRYYPEENQYWVEEACKELGIPVIHSEHGYTEEEFKDLVHNCTFMTCAYREASTGGLSLMEGLYNGKLSLVSNSPYMGAIDYLGQFGTYFQYDDFDDLKKKIRELWECPPDIDIKEVREYMQYFSHKTFAERIIKNICDLNKNS